MENIIKKGMRVLRYEVNRSVEEEGWGNFERIDEFLMWGKLIGKDMGRREGGKKKKVERRCIERE